VAFSGEGPRHTEGFKERDRPVTEAEAEMVGNCPVALSIISVGSGATWFDGGSVKYDRLVRGGSIPGESGGVGEEGSCLKIDRGASRRISRAGYCVMCYGGLGYGRSWWWSIGGWHVERGSVSKWLTGLQGTGRRLLGWEMLTGLPIFVIRREGRLGRRL